MAQTCRFSQDRMSKHSGCYGLTEVESITMMALWCIWATPLLMSNDLTNISAADKAILQNKHAIAGASVLRYAVACHYAAPS